MPTYRINEDGKKELVDATVPADASKEEKKVIEVARALGKAPPATKSKAKKAVAKPSSKKEGDK